MDDCDNTSVNEAAAQNVEDSGAVMYEGESEVQPEPIAEPKWAVSRSKTATALDANDESRVTLSLPSAQEKLASDIVFVLDKSSCAKLVTTSALQMLDSLKTEVSENESKIQIGVVVFGGDAKVSYPLSTFPTTGEQFAELETALTQKPSGLMGGTNMHAGLLAAQEMLRNSTTDKNRQYVILVSDGLPRLFTGSDGKTKDIYYQYIESDRMGEKEVGDGVDQISPIHCLYYGMIGEWENVRTGRDNPEYRQGSYSVPYGDWDKYFSKVKDWVKADGDMYALDYATYGNDASAKVKDTVTGDIKDPDFKYIGHTDYEHHAMSVDRAVYEAYNAFTGMVDDGYRCYAYLSDSTEFGQAFMGAMNSYAKNDDNISFDKIGNDILYVVGAGSTVEDKMGPDFDFAGLDTMTLTISNEQDSTTLSRKIDGNTAYFGDADADVEKLSEVNYRFKVVYDKDSDMFTWTIDENVSNFNHVQLSYQVKLVKRETAPGTYTVPTNGDTYLYPVSSDGKKGAQLDFKSPSVSYTVKPSYRPPAPTVEIPDEDALGLNTDDHFAYIIGYPDGTVRPNGQITRAEATTIFFRLLTDDSRDANLTKTNGYTDVAFDAWYNTAVSTMTKAGIVDGYPDGTFRPDAPITRAEMAKIISLFAKLDKSESRFSDIAGHWAEAYIRLAAGNGWIAGYPDGTFGPQRNITRAETATMINRVLDRVPSEESRLLSRDVMQIWPDSNPGDWFYLAMQEATNSHDYKRDAKWAAADEQWTALRETRDWKALEQ